MSTPFAELVLDHYRRHARDLPWRRTRDPYAIWICEVMAQQTRLETMLPYWERWLAKFPTPAALAAAALDDVLAAWAGLGYYARARALHAAAKQIVGAHGGRFPSRPEAIAALPGIGPYTAGAVGSIAFGHRLSVVDGNVTRVLARVHALDDVASTAGRRRLGDLAAAAVPAEAPGDYNQGLMDLGATICTSRNPRCLVCPLAAVCLARAQGRQAELPAPKVRAPVAERVIPLAWVVEDGRWLVARRLPGGLYGGLWELPEAEWLGIRPAGEPLAEHTHHLTHRTFMYRVFAAPGARVGAAAPPYDAVRLIDPVHLADLAISSATRRLAATLLSKGDPWPTPKRQSPSSRKATRPSSPASTSSVTRSTKIRTSSRPPGGRRAGSPR